ncbi:MAG: hemolysin family protein, partial [Actinomycetota bacterium]
MTLWYLAVGVALLLLNAFFVAAEFAAVAARRERIESLAQGGKLAARTAIKSSRELSFMLAGAQLGITMASLGLGFVAEPAVAHLIEAGIEPFVALPSGVLHAISFTVALAIVSFLHMVVGEMAPKNIAISRPERSALVLAIPFRAYANLFRPFIHVLNHMANGLVRMLRVEPVDELRSIHSIEDISAVISESARGGYLGKFEHLLLSGAVRFGERDAGSVMIPRTEIVALPATATPVEIEQVLVTSGHSRLPVYRDDLDQVLGFVHAKEVLAVPEIDRDRPLRSELIREMLVVPESRKLHPLLLDMRRERRHFALVVDEHGGTAGIVTLEDLLEELVGDIRDEHDQGEAG